MTDDRLMMGKALAEAARPLFTSPNPRVGAVVVRDGELLSTGGHHGVGTPHAEIVALRDLDARGADMFVTLEPCAHQGLTPPCAPALVAAGLKRVVIALEDPDPRVQGRGISILREGGIEVLVGPGADEASLQNAAYLHNRRTGGPLITLKLALTLDGRLAAADGSSRWITGEKARERVHRRRCETDALMVGAGTVLADDPSLDVRGVEGALRHPAVVVVDASGRVPPSARIFRVREREVVVATCDSSGHDVQMGWKQAGAEVLVMPSEGTGKVHLGALLESLSGRDWVEITVEGGADLATSFLRDGLVDRLEIYRGPKMTGAGPSLGPLGVDTMERALSFRPVWVESLGDDVLTIMEAA